MCLCVCVCMGCVCVCACASCMRVRVRVRVRTEGSPIGEGLLPVQRRERKIPDYATERPIRGSLCARLGKQQSVQQRCGFLPTLVPLPAGRELPASTGVRGCDYGRTTTLHNTHTKPSPVSSILRISGKQKKLWGWWGWGCGWSLLSYQKIEVV